MENVCKKQGEQFMWKATMNDNSIINEFTDNNETNDIIECVMGNPNLTKFGLCGNGYYSNFDTETGIFNLFDGVDKIQVKLISNGKDLMETDEIKNKVIMFRTAQNMFEPAVGHGIDKIFRYTFGYKLENDLSYIRSMIAFDMYESILFQMSITGKVDTTCELHFIINDKVAAMQNIVLEKGVRQEIEIPLKMLTNN